MIHSKNVTKEVIEKEKINGFIEIEFEPYNLSEEIRINKLLRGWKVSKPTYKKYTIEKTYTLK